MFLKNKNIIFKIRRSKVTDYAALSSTRIFKDGFYAYVMIINSLPPGYFILFIVC